MTVGETKKDESLVGLLKRTINEGAPIYNHGDHKGCHELYLNTANYASKQEYLIHSKVGQLLERATTEAIPLSEAGDYGEAAWVLRSCFDDILSRSHSKSPCALVSEQATSEIGGKRQQVVSHTRDDLSDDDDYWQDEKAGNESDLDIGNCLADFAYILRSTIQPKTHKRYTGKIYENSFQGNEVVEVLTGLGLVKDRKAAAEKCSMLLKGDLLLRASHKTDTSFLDGAHLYRFPDQEQLQTAYDNLIEDAPKDGHYTEGSLQAQLTIALQKTLALFNDKPSGVISHHVPSGSFSHLKPRRLSSMASHETRGVALANFAAEAERVLDIRDRTHLLKKYEKCFVGNDAVKKLAQKNIVASKEEALVTMEELVDVGLIHHVLYDHGFESSHLFYRFTSSEDIRRSLDALAILPSAPTGQELVRQAALQTRYNQFADLDVAAILNSFFGSGNKGGWDLVDLQNWRDNMKRWGFGRREDQDDEMVDKLSPLALIVNPDTWYESLTDEEREKWESPWGILAQIAIFDQVPRSAFRGTPEAFKWDDLAIRATKVALEKVYFETAYKSTLNQFLVLLPLEHSEDWEDQKLGVSLIMRLLSTVAIQDEGLTDYEIVKRLEFSKRLSAAFLEHAQVVRQFHRFPHRNSPLSRKTSLEERIWLASDLVPRWAKSQQKGDSKNVVHLPAIPLKRLVRK